MFESLVDWYKKEARNLPWRETKNPYKIWLSEVILQQTRVDQGMKYYQKFVSTYPDIAGLANAPLDEILLLWQGLGYYSRARNLHAAANYIVEKYNGNFPAEVDELKKIKGIGDYTAAAIASFAFKISVPVVDGNVFRVLSRYFEISDPIDTPVGKKKILELATSVMNSNEPDIHNQAMMELGALVCKPKQPVCNLCPLMYSCGANINQTFAKYPVKKVKVKQRKRYFYYLIIELENEMLIEKRKEQDIWQDLYQFPLLETKNPMSDKEILEQIADLSLFSGKSYTILKISDVEKHILSHQIIFSRFVHIKANHPINAYITSRLKVERKNLIKYAFPRLITRYLEKEYPPLYSKSES